MNDICTCIGIPKSHLAFQACRKLFFFSLFNNAPFLQMTFLSML